MSANAPTNQAPAKNTETGIQVWQPADVTKLMDQYPSGNYNRLFPVEALSQVNPYLAPRIEAVRLNPDESAGEIYHDPQMKAGMYGPTKVGLRKLMDLAGATMVDSRRMDDGSDPWYVLWRVTMELAVPGRPPRRAMGSKEIRLSGEGVRGWTPERLAKAREHMIAMAESKAANRALRDLLTLRSSYPKAELTKPFAVMRWEPNMSHPAVAERFLDNLLPATVAAYGPQDAVPELGAGTDQPYELAPHVADDDDQDTVHEGSFVEVKTNGHATVERASGEIVGGSPEPDWGFDTVAAPAPRQAPAASLAERLQAAADALPDLTGPVPEPEQGKVKALLRPLVVPNTEDPAALVNAGLEAAFGLAKLGALQERHVRAMLAVADEMKDPAFVEAWRAMAAGTDR